MEHLLLKIQSVLELGTDKSCTLKHVCVSVYTHTHRYTYFNKARFKNLNSELLTCFILPYHKNKVNEDKRRKRGLIGTAGRAEFKVDTVSYWCQETQMTLCF